MKKIFIALAAFLAATAPLMAAPAEKPALTKPNAVDARAVALIDKSIAAYGELKSFSQPFVISNTFDGKQRADMIGTFSLARPNVVRAQYEVNGVNRLAISDGKTVITGGRDKKFVQGKSQGSPTYEILSGMPSAMYPFFNNLVIGVNDMKSAYSSVQFSAQPKSEIVTVQSEQFTYSLVFDSKTHLLSSMSMRGEVEEKKVVETTTFGETQINIDPATLAFVLPEGATLEQAVTEPNDAEAYDPRLVIGAAPFPLSGKTLDGKALSLDSMKGKVVLLDFWATWCGPCIAVLPNLKANYDKYHARDFEVVGISLDDDEESLPISSKKKRCRGRRFSMAKAGRRATPKLMACRRFPSRF